MWVDNVRVGTCDSCVTPHSRPQVHARALWHGCTGVNRGTQGNHIKGRRRRQGALRFLQAPGGGPRHQAGSGGGAKRAPSCGWAPSGAQGGRDARPRLQGRPGGRWAPACTRAAWRYTRKRSLSRRRTGHSRCPSRCTGGRPHAAHETAGRRRAAGSTRSAATRALLTNARRPTPTSARVCRPPASGKQISTTSFSRIHVFHAASRPAGVSLVHGAGLARALRRHGGRQTCTRECSSSFTRLPGPVAPSRPANTSARSAAARTPPRLMATAAAAAKGAAAATARPRQRTPAQARPRPRRAPARGQAPRARRACRRRTHKTPAAGKSQARACTTPIRSTHTIPFRATTQADAKDLECPADAHHHSHRPGSLTSWVSNDWAAPPVRRSSSTLGAPCPGASRWPAAVGHLVCLQVRHPRRPAAARAALPPRARGEPAAAAPRAPHTRGRAAAPRRRAARHATFSTLPTAPAGRRRRAGAALCRGPDRPARGAAANHRVSVSRDALRPAADPRVPRPPRRAAPDVPRGAHGGARTQGGRRRRGGDLRHPVCGFDCIHGGRAPAGRGRGLIWV